MVNWFNAAGVLATNLFVLAGVALWDWPAGNVFLLFWIENLTLGAVAVVRIRTAEGFAPMPSSADPGGPPQPRGALLREFVRNYCLLVVLHFLFLTMSGFTVDAVYTFWALGLPAALIALRHLAELGGTWFLGRQRLVVTPEEARQAPYARVFILQLATLLGVFLGPRSPAAGLGIFNPVIAWFNDLGFSLDAGVVLVGVLIAIKTATELGLVTARVGDIEIPVRR